MPFALCALLFLLLSVTSCQSNGNGSESKGTAIAMKYATLLKMEEGDGFINVEISNPWDSASVLHRYVLVPRDADLPTNLPNGELVRTPISNAVVYSSVHCQLIDEFGAFGAIKGICDAQYMTIGKCLDGLKKGTIADLGDGNEPNIEKIIDLQPDAILLSPYQDSGNYGRLGKLGVPIIECADYLETGPLARAEWVRFFGLLFGKAEKADSIFANTEKEYNALKAIVPANEKKPTVIADTKYGSSWYISGNNSTTGQLFADAGAAYIFADEASSTAVPYDPEVVFDRAHDADVWIIKYNQATDKTYDELARDYANYAQMKPFRTHNIYGCNSSVVPFYEETPFHPELLLKDYIKIFHPNCLPDYKLRYFKKLCE